MTTLGPLQRVRMNWEFMAGRLRKAQQRRASAGDEASFSWKRAVVAVAAAIAVIVLGGLIFDARVIAWAHGLPNPVRSFFRWITRFGQSEWLLVPSGVIVIIVSLGDWRRVSRANAAAWWEIAAFAAVLFVVIAASGLVTDIIKPIVGRFRPDYVTPGVFPFAPLSFGGYSHYSFPSGHATTMAAVAAMAGFVPTVVTLPIVVAAGLVAISRVIIEVHFPSDVVGGTLIGLAVGLAILRGMREAGVVYVARGGRVRYRFDILRRLGRQRDGLAGLFPALWIALSPAPRRGQTPPPDQP